MIPYQNLSGQSGVVAFEIGTTYIKVKFRNGTYTYDNRRPGARYVDEMKRLAVAGRGLNTYIDRYIKKNYSSKSRF